MCYSAMYVQDLRKWERDYRAVVDIESFKILFQRRLEIPTKIKLPSGLENFFYDSELEFRPLINEWHEWAEGEEQKNFSLLKERIAKNEEKILKKPNQSKGAQKDREVALRKWQALELAQLERRNGRKNGHPRFFPGWFSPLLIEERGKKSIVPARYRILPETGVEIPSKYNVFNARFDMLEQRVTWKKLFTYNHALLPFTHFFEWVEDENGRSKEIVFNPESEETVEGPALFEYCEAGKSPYGIPTYSFAFVTIDPPDEVSDAGHDRCVAHPPLSQALNWLEKDMDYKQILQTKRSIYFDHQAAS